MRYSDRMISVRLGDLTMIRSMARTVKGVGPTGIAMMDRIGKILDDAWIETQKEPQVTIPWNEQETIVHRGIARNLFYADAFHNSGGCQAGKLEQDNCSVCYLRGYGADDKDGPNYAGWARIYVEAGEPIPAKWLAAFQAERDSDNRAYAAALDRSIFTYGVTFV